MFLDELHTAFMAVARLVLHHFRVHRAGILNGRGGGIGGLLHRRGRHGRLLATCSVKSDNGQQCDGGNHSEFDGYFHVFFVGYFIP